MASRLSLLFLPALSVLLLLSLSADARPGVHFHPCNTFVISTYSFTLLRPQNPNPNPNPNTITIFADIRPDGPHFLRHRHPRHRFFLPILNDRYVPREGAHHIKHERLHHDRDLSFPLGFSSLKDRTKDILNVVASLLLGAACGALTAGTMYLVWSICNHRNDEAYRNLDGFSSDDGDDDDEEDIFNPKKPAYVAIPAEAPVKEAVKESA